MVGAATSVAVRPVSSSDEVYETDDPSDLASLREALRIEDAEMGHCMCLGTLAFVFRRDGDELGAVTLHHGESLRWDPFFDNAPLVESDPILDWLSARGMPGAREEYDDDRRREQEAAAAEERWRAAMPPNLLFTGEESRWTVWKPLESRSPSFSPSDGWPEVAEVMSREYPDPVKRARVLMEWFGQGEGPWNGYPDYEDVPEWCLLQLPVEVLVEAAQAKPQSVELREGAARLFAGWSFASACGSDLAKIPVDLKRVLLAHALESADEDIRARARHAFGS